MHIFEEKVVCRFFCLSEAQIEEHHESVSW